VYLTRNYLRRGLRVRYSGAARIGDPRNPAPPVTRMRFARGLQMSLPQSLAVVHLKNGNQGIMVKSVELGRFRVPWRADDVPRRLSLMISFACRRHYSFPDLSQSRHGGKGRKG